MLNNKILVTNTMLVQASRFFDDKYFNISLRDSDRIFNFFDFSSLVESIILYDEITTLEGKIYPEFKDCNLLSKLIAENILLENSLPFEINKIQRKFIDIVGSGIVFSRIGKGIPARTTNMIPELFPDDIDDWSKEGFDSKFQRKTFLQAINLQKSNQYIINSNNVYDFFRNDDGFSNFISGTGDYERGAYTLRTIIYQLIATNNQLMFYPDFPRIPIVKNLNGYMRNSITMEVYTSFAKKLKADVSLLLQDKEPINLIIPPFTSLLLNRCSNKNEIFDELMTLREEFSELRKQLRKLEDNQLNCTNIKERIDFKNKTDRMFKAVSKKYNSKYFITLEESLGYVENAAKPLYNPNDPSSYSASILLLPIEKIKDWFYRRPLNQFFNLKKELYKIDNYTKLVKKVFDIDFSDQEVKTFNNTVDILNSTFSK